MIGFLSLLMIGSLSLTDLIIGGLLVMIGARSLMIDALSLNDRTFVA